MEKLPGVIQFLKTYGATVYIDKADKTLPQKTTSETGARLKDMIGKCRKFIVLVTPNSKSSCWIPWELGIGDQKKSLRSVAILPANQDGLREDWPAQEYLGMYPRIVWNKFKGNSKPEWMVLDHHDNSGTALREWLER